MKINKHLDFSKKTFYELFPLQQNLLYFSVLLFNNKMVHKNKKIKISREKFYELFPL